MHVSEYAGRYVTPGLIDVLTRRPPTNVLRLSPYFSLLYLFHGITTIRDVGDLDSVASQDVREALLHPSPRLVSCASLRSGRQMVDDANVLLQRFVSRGVRCVSAHDANLNPEFVAQLIDSAATHHVHVIGKVPPVREMTFLY